MADVAVVDNVAVEELAAIDDLTIAEGGIVSANLINVCGFCTSSGSWQYITSSSTTGSASAIEYLCRADTTYTWADGYETQGARTVYNGSVKHSVYDEYIPGVHYVQHLHLNSLFAGLGEAYTVGVQFYAGYYGGVRCSGQISEVTPA